VSPENNIKEENLHENELAEPVEEYGADVEPSEPENFDPTTTPKSFDITKISAKTKTFTNATAKAEASYSKIQSQEAREDVGRWCEEFVNEFLINQKDKFTEVTWINKDGESGKPYDFEIVESGKVKYIDVKGTPSGVKDLIYLSPNEWKFMFDKRENYS